MKGAALHPGILGLLAIGLLCGWLAQQIGTPLPYLLGSLLGVGATVIIAGNHMPDGVTFPQNIRAAFVVVIGVMIGGAFNPSIFGDLPGLLLSGGLILVFVGFSFGANFLIFKKIGGYDAQTAFCAGMPGGLIESIEMAEQSGADTRIVTAQQFLRVVIVIVTLPLIFAYWTGAPVGSAARKRRGFCDFRNRPADARRWRCDRHRPIRVAPIPHCRSGTSGPADGNGTTRRPCSAE